MCNFVKIFIVFFFYSNFSIANSQIEKIKKYSELPVLYNLDSLESVVRNNKINKVGLFNTIATIEKSRINLYSCDIGKNLPQLSSLAKSLNSKLADLVLLQLKIELQINQEDSKVEIFNNLNKLRETAELLNDDYTIAIAYHKLMCEQINGRAYENMPLNTADSFMINQYHDSFKKIAKNHNEIVFKILESHNEIEYSLAMKDNVDVVIDKCNIMLKLLDNEIKYNFAKLYYYISKSIAYSNLENSEEAIFWARKCLEFETLNCSSIKTHNYFTLANCYYNNDNYDSAKYYYVNCINNSNYNNNRTIRLLEYCYDRLSVINYYQENYKIGYEQLYVRDSLFALRVNKQRENLALELAQKYQYEKNKMKIDLLENQKKNFLLSLLISFLIIFVIGILLIRIYIQNRKIKALNFFKNKIHSVISHDLRSPLFSLQQLYFQAAFLIRKNQIDTLNLLSEKIDLASINIGNLLDNLLLWSNKNKVNVLEYSNVSNIVKEVIDLYSQIAEAKKIQLVNNIDDQLSIQLNKNVLNLIIRNWLDNLLKHTSCSKITFSAKNNINQIEIIVKDDGKIEIDIFNKINALLSGKFKQETLLNSHGIGLLLIQYFMNVENWKVTLKKINEENVFCISIPIYSKTN